MVGSCSTVCDGDPELLAWVERFLAGVADDDFPVSLPSAIVAGAFADDSGATPDAEARFGAYRIVGALGRGGMGSVFLADRADGQFEQRVAIKVMHRGIGGRDGRERFLRERQILARLDHPNVAHLVDGGICYLSLDFAMGRLVNARIASSPRAAPMRRF
ncbi:MAG: protein kinase [Gemmatimonadaceae bacterium]